MFGWKNIREIVYFSIFKSRGQPVGSYYAQYCKEIEDGIPSEAGKNKLIHLLDHCKTNVAYFQQVMKNMDDSYQRNPYEYLAKLPILTKEIIQNQFETLKSNDLDKRRWEMNTTGGSTGEPVNFIQDYDFLARAGAIKMIFSRLVSPGFGAKQVYFWGSVHDITGGTESWRSKLINWIANRHFMGIFSLEPEIVQDYVDYLNQNKPDLIIAYVWVLDELSKVIERENIRISQQNSIISTAGTLHSEIRERVEKVFQCRVYNRYGTREVGDIACERPGIEGLWVAPWGNFIEVVDENGNRLPDGEEGELLVTSLSNYAMPLIRYQIGDRGVLVKREYADHQGIQIIEKITGRTIDRFVNRNGRSVDAGYFMPLFYHRDWIHKYQVVQKSISSVEIRIVPGDSEPGQQELDEIIRVGKDIMHDEDCEIKINFVSNIENDRSGKYRFIKSETPATHTVKTGDAESD